MIFKCVALCMVLSLITSHAYSMDCYELIYAQVHNEYEEVLNLRGSAGSIVNSSLQWGCVMSAGATTVFLIDSLTGNATDRRKNLKAAFYSGVGFLTFAFLAHINKADFQNNVMMPAAEGENLV